MKVPSKLTIAATTLALGVAPTAALAQAHPGSQGKSSTAAGHTKTTTTTPSSSNAQKYGKYCQGVSKKRVSGEKGTPFSQCVNAMADAAHNKKMTARAACASLSKKHVAGEKRTPFADCVSGVAKLRSSTS